MKYFELFGIPILMLSDYYLTVLGSFYWKAKWGKHIIREAYELNPIWRKDIENPKWINYKHLIIVVFATFFIYGAIESDNTNSYYVIGYFFTSFALVNGRHLSSIFLFRYIIRHPNEISGKVNLTHILVLKMSQLQIIVTAFPILILTVLTPSPFLIGGLISCVSLFIVHIFWAENHRKKIKALNKGLGGIAITLD